MYHWYYRIFFQFIRWWAVAFIAIAGLIGICVLIDWFGHVGWGYPWYSLPVLAASIVIGVLIYKAAVYALVRIGQSEKQIRTKDLGIRTAPN
jgi:hypothetical protein